MGTRRPWRAPTAVAALLLAGAAALLGAPVAAAGPAPATGGTPAQVASALPGEELNELVEPSIVHLTVAWEGYVRHDLAGEWVWSEPIQVAYGCSGFFVTATGHIMTAGHCVEPDSGKQEVITAYLTGLVQQGVLTPADAEAILPTALLDWGVEGRADGAPMDRVVQAVQPRAVDGAVLATPLNAQVIDFRSFADGDLALLKVETTGAVPLPVAGADPRSGSALTAVGFPGAVGEVVDVNLVRASFKTGTVSSTQVSATGVAQIEVNADMSGGMSGGPTVDAVGNALGVNSFRIDGETQAFNFITDTTDLAEWLGAKNLQLAALRTAPAPEAAPAPAAPPAAPAWQVVPLWVWAVIGALALALLAAVVVAVVRSRRGRTVRAVAPVAAYPPPPAPGQWARQDVPWMPRQQGAHPAPAPAPDPRTVPVASNASAPTVSYAKPPAPTPAAPRPDSPAPAAMPGTCAGCGQANGSAARFCSGCGTRL